MSSAENRPRSFDPADDRGAVGLLTLFLLLMIVPLGMLAVNMWVIQAEYHRIHEVADAAARAGANAIDLDQFNADRTLVLDQGQATSWALDNLRLNESEGDGVFLEDISVVGDEISVTLETTVTLFGFDAFDLTAEAVASPRLQE